MPSQDGSDAPYDLERFVRAQEPVYDDVLGDSAHALEGVKAGGDFRRGGFGHAQALRTFLA